MLSLFPALASFLFWSQALGGATIPLANPLQVGCFALSQDTSLTVGLADIPTLVRPDCITPQNTGSTSLQNQQCRTDGVYLGTSGNVDTPNLAGTPTSWWSKDTVIVPVAGVTLELGLRITGRTTSTFQYGPLDGAVPIRAGQGWKMDWSVRILDPTPTSTLKTITGNDPSDVGGRFEFGIDIDPSDNVDFLVYDPISFVYRAALEGLMQTDHSFLKGGQAQFPVETYDGGTNFPADYLNLMQVSTGAQNSFQPRFSAQVAAQTQAPLGACTVLTAGSSPCAFPTGRYEAYLLYSRGGVELARVQVSVFQASTDVPPALIVDQNPSTLDMPCTLIAE